MSRNVALDNIWLRPSPRWGHTEYSLHYHKELLSRHTGLPVGTGLAHHRLVQRGFDVFQFDFCWNTGDGLVSWEKSGRVTDMGHASYSLDGSDQARPGESPFKAPEEVWEFDAVGEYGLPDFDEQVKSYEEIIRKVNVEFPGQLTTGGYYKTIVSGAIQAFGWDMLLLAAADPVSMEKVFDSFFRRTLFFMQAWAKTSAEVIIQHDDFVWTGGPFMHPDIYRRVIIPRYAELWKPLHAAGKKVLFCSDGNYMELAADVAAAGADGFIFEPCNDFGFMAENFGRTKCLVGSFVDCRDLTFGKKDEVRRAIDRTFESLSRCKGAIVAVGNHLAPNIHGEMLDFYFENLLPCLNK
ncbi:MAG: uroporphyrinogen decarboxylase family protein [Kiritimatiellia bacterium]